MVAWVGGHLFPSELVQAVIGLAAFVIAFLLTGFFLEK